MEEIEVRVSEKEKEWRLLGPFQTDYILLCGESEEDLRVMIGPFKYAKERE